MGQPNPPADPGATPPATDPPTPDPAAAAMATDEGKKALAELRQQIKDLQKENKTLQDRDPVKALMEALGQKPEPGKDALGSLTEQVRTLQRQHAEAELKAARLEVAAAKGLTPAQAARLHGGTREELEADADALKTLFPSSATPGTPAPDPSQGARGGSSDLDARITAAQAKANATDPNERRAGIRELIRLKEEKAAKTRQ